MKAIKILFLHGFIGFSQLLYSQENLIPNGHFDENTQDYNGGYNPVAYYTADQNCNEGRDRFEEDITSWFVAKSNANLSELPGSFLNPQRRCSPDWIAPYAYDHSTTCSAQHTSFYLSHGVANESVMAEMKNGYKLIKGKTYKFRVKVRSALGSGSFQLVFSKDSEGLHVQPHKKWVAGDFYLTQDCNWKNIEYFFTVPTSNDKDYEDMNYVILQFNHEINLDQFGSKVAIHYDDVFLSEGEKCEDVKYIQDWIYFETSEIVQANQEIRAGAHVSPYSWDENLPVIVKSGSYVIYRAPSVYLEPGFFIEEPGSYFETQVGTCVEDPCPSIPSFVPPTNTVCNNSTPFGADIPHQPGVFYVWEPSQYFSAPWSVQTNFIPPTGSGCVNASLTIWTICGDQQTFNFPVSYFDTPATVDFSQVVMNPNHFSFDIEVNNANSFSIEAINTTTGEIIHSSQQSVSCNSVAGTFSFPFSFTPCQYNMCGEIQVNVTASNDCFGGESQSLVWSAPPPQQPIIHIDNLVMTDFEYSFDITNITNSFEYVQVQVLNANQTEVLCEEMKLSCNNPNLSSWHFDATSCLNSECLSQCENFVVKVTMKNVCNSNLVSQVLNWTKSVTTLTPQSNWPNVITLNGDNINDLLCFTPQGADHYDFVVVNNWGNPFYESSGCIDEIPICIWAPPTNITDGTYFYIIELSNTCGETLTHQDFVQVINEFNGMVQNDEINEFENVANGLNSNDYTRDENNVGNAVQINEEIWIYPNPTNDKIRIESTALIHHIQTFNSIGSEIKRITVGEKHSVVELKEFGSGVYTLFIHTTQGVICKKVIVI